MAQRRRSRISTKPIQMPFHNMDHQFQMHFTKETQSRKSFIKQFNLNQEIKSQQQNERMIELPVRNSIKDSQISNNNELTERLSIFQSKLKKEQEIIFSKEISKKKLEANKNINKPKFKNKSYEFLNLTLTFQNSNFVKKIFTILFTISVFVRIWTLLYLIFILYIESLHNHLERWEWIAAFIICRVLYFLMVLKISFTINQSQIGIFLKNCWCPFDRNDIFDRLTSKKVLRSLMIALVPPQLCFVYLSKENKVKRFTIFAVVNFIYLSIQVTIFQTCLIVYFYLFLIPPKEKYLEGFVLYVYISFFVNAGWMIIFWVFSFYLLIQGLMIKYQKI